MGNFNGHFFPGLFIVLFGIVMFAHHLHRHLVLTQPHLPLTAVPAYSLLSSPVVRQAAYLIALIWAVIHSSVEMIMWDGDYTSMSSLQHATMNYFIIAAALTGLLIDHGVLSRHSRWMIGLVFTISGMLILSHSAPDPYESAVHHIQGYSLALAGVVVGVYNILVVVVDEWLDNPTKPLSPLLISTYSFMGRFAVFLTAFSGAWFLYIAFAQWNWWTGDSTPHAPFEAHLQTLMMAWVSLFVLAIMVTMEVAWRRYAGVWPQSIYHHGKDVRVTTRKLGRQNQQKRFSTKTSPSSYADTSNDSSPASRTERLDRNTDKVHIQDEGDGSVELDVLDESNINQL